MPKSRKVKKKVAKIKIKTVAKPKVKAISKPRPKTTIKPKVVEKGPIKISKTYEPKETEKYMCENIKYFLE
jgi:hypothetical protein